jgi:hypothetical protein
VGRAAALRRSWKLRSVGRHATRQSARMDNRLDQGRLKREWRTLQAMVAIYCDGHAHDRTATTGLCTDCAGFLDYAARRLEKCPYGPAKPTCAKCPIHCYKPAPRELARQVMRYSGPRMVLRHPWLSLTHVADKARGVEHPMTVRRRQRRAPTARED